MTARNQRSIEPAESIDAADGPAMRALPNQKYRDFVRAHFQLPEGRGWRVRAAKLAGFGKATSSAQTMAVIAWRLAQDERVLAALSEMDQKFLRTTGARALRA